MRGMTKAVCQRFEKLCETEITKVLGEPVVWNLNGLAWSFPYGETGCVEIHLIRDSFDKGNVYRSSWLACKHRDPAMVDASGYHKAGTRHPSPFSHPSGKYNLHPGDRDTLEKMRRDLAYHLYCMAPHGSREKEAFGKIEWEPA